MLALQLLLPRRPDLKSPIVEMPRGQLGWRRCQDRVFKRDRIDEVQATRPHGHSPFSFHPLRSTGGSGPEQEEGIPGLNFAGKALRPVFATAQSSNIQEDVKVGHHLLHALDLVQHCFTVCACIRSES